MNITLAIDEKLADRARQAAQAMGKSLNQAVRDYLEQLAGQAQLDAELQPFRASAIDTLGRLEVVPTSTDLIAAALDLQVLHGTSFWDALIVQAARQSGCIQLLSEDMASGAVLGGVRLVNPFA